MDRPAILDLVPLLRAVGFDVLKQKAQVLLGSYLADQLRTGFDPFTFRDDWILRHAVERICQHSLNVGWGPVRFFDHTDSVPHPR